MDLPDPENAIPRELRDAVLDPARRDQTVSVEGGEVEVRFDPEPGVDVRMQFPQAPEGMAFTTYNAADERPASYPPELPFLPGIAATVLAPADGEDAGAWAMWGVPEAELEGVLDSLRTQSAADGWVEGEESGLGFLPGLRILSFEQPDGRQRMLQVVSTGGDNAMISLLEPRE